MTFGILLKGMNAIYFNSMVDFIFEFIPQLIFMSLLFGYMIIMIFIKWATDWSNDTSKAPSIITLLMNIFLNGGSVDHKPLWGNEEIQVKTHQWFLIICLICVPILLFPKPILLYRRQIHEEQENKKKDKELHHLAHTDYERLLVERNLKLTSPKHDEGFGDLFIHQVIETIEFVLGSISNTASYLRLWALSLAHAQLSKVFFEKALLGFIQSRNLILVIIGFFIFANITFFVLMCMDLLECFLHTLRLHWVEFQNKFFKADGHKFAPFSFKYLVETE